MMNTDREKSLWGHPMIQSLAVRAISISMGFVFFAGGWRRFFNDPLKHDITSPAHLAGKLVQAAPGSPIESTIHWVLYHPWAAEWSTYIMSSAEILVGLCLMLGLLTRLAAVGSAIINVCLMLIFGWMGFECLDEWTMAALGFAISVTIMLTGSGTYSIDSLLGKDWFASLFRCRKLQMLLIVLSTLMTVGFYSYYFGFFKLQRLTSVGEYKMVAEKVVGQNDRITLYVNGGGSSNPAYVKGIRFTLNDGTTITQTPDQIQVLRSHFEPWSKNSGKLVDGVMKLLLGSKVDIAIPAGAVSAEVDIIGNKKDPVLKW
ncbi:TQO small subunit DoxD [Basilea psittacipulmonis]|uniref:TQO small subunit DoxD n=1 Tax=Basilea psittacipulmonis TaxID=1472345 RepID=UPI00068A68F9|nr:TQO small subunit DoxD [Basilea psittacipulmonis]